MAFDIDTTTKTDDRLIAPATCRCGREAQVVTLTVTHKNTGQVKSGAASEFCGRDNSNNPNWVLQDWWTKPHFIAKCGECLAGASVPGKRQYTDKQVRVAWMWFMGEISKDSAHMPFKPIEMTDEQRDTALEIVNYEARRTNEPDAIPDEYKISHVWAN